MLAMRPLKCGFFSQPADRNQYWLRPSHPCRRASGRVEMKRHTHTHTPRHTQTHTDTRTKERRRQKRPESVPSVSSPAMMITCGFNTQAEIVVSRQPESWPEAE